MRPTAFITGCAGFIGSQLTDRLLEIGWRVVGFDDFSTGQRSFLQSALQDPNFSMIEGDLLDLRQFTAAIRGVGDVDRLFHLAANADVRFNTLHPTKTFNQNTIVTFNVLEGMRFAGVRKIAFSSTGSVYGEAAIFPTPEDAPFPVQTSLYGATKLASEGLIAAYCKSFGFQAWIFRLVSILGERYTHGHIFDFYRQLRCDPTRLRVLGNGKQRKSYLYVHDCIDAMLLATEKTTAPYNLFNLGLDGFCDVNDSIGWLTETLGVKPQLEYTGGDRGWAGDNPFIFLDTARIRALGWQPQLDIRRAVLKTVDYIRQNEWLLEARA
jgi:UDP-glucose 4-epimerase